MDLFLQRKRRNLGVNTNAPVNKISSQHKNKRYKKKCLFIKKKGCSNDSREEKVMVEYSTVPTTMEKGGRGAEWRVKAVVAQRKTRLAAGFDGDAAALVGAATAIEEDEE